MAKHGTAERFGAELSTADGSTPERSAAACFAPRCAERETATARGQRAEALACAWLEVRGYHIIDRNHRCAGGEVDVIAWRDEVLCFVEVRARSSDAFGHPLETIDAAKIKRVIRAARHYLDTFMQAREGPMPPIRFDALGILLTDPPEFALAEEAFETQP